MLTILEERTIAELNIDPNTLNQDAHDKIFVKCSICQEEFLREMRNLRNPHACPRSIHKNGKVLKFCGICHNYLSVDEFAQDSYSCVKCGFNHEYHQIFDVTPTRAECILKHPKAKLPTKKRTTDAGHDLYSVESKVIPYGSSDFISTGVHISVPEGWYFTIEGRSSLFVKGITPSRGIIDANYCGEIVVWLMNVSRLDYKIEVGDRIAQLILHRHHDIDITCVEEFGPDYNFRGGLGFGSSGR